MEVWPAVPVAPAPPSTHGPLIRLRGVVKRYAGAGGEVAALKGITTDFRHGEFAAVVGKSGAGKSTLVNMITGVDQLTAGEVWVGDTPVHALDEDPRALWRGRTLGVVYQSFQLLPTLSLLENVLLPMDFCGLYRARESRERAMDLLTQVGLAEHARKPPTRISGGQQQRVAIARALANDPPIVVADEPTGNLDSVTAGAILELLEGLVRQGRTVIVVTHDRVVARRAQRILHIADGEIIDETTNETTDETIDDDRTPEP